MDPKEQLDHILILNTEKINNFSESLDIINELGFIIKFNDSLKRNNKFPECPQLPQGIKFNIIIKNPFIWNAICIAKKGFNKYWKLKYKMKNIIIPICMINIKWNKYYTDLIKDSLEYSLWLNRTSLEAKNIATIELYKKLNPYIIGLNYLRHYVIVKYIEYEFKNIKNMDNTSNEYYNNIIININDWSKSIKNFFKYNNLQGNKIPHNVIENKKINNNNKNNYKKSKKSKNNNNNNKKIKKTKKTYKKTYKKTTKKSKNNNNNNNKKM